jgi:hypothetical protein
MPLVMLMLLLGMTGASALQRQAPAKDPFFQSALTAAEMAGKQAVLETSYGTIVMDLLAEAAPTHVAHFITRAREGVYDGTTFHRVIPMGIVQGGDPLSKDPEQVARYGTGGPPTQEQRRPPADHSGPVSPDRGYWPCREWEPRRPAVACHSHQR